MLSCKLHARKVLDVLSQTASALSSGHSGRFVLYLAGEQVRQRPYTDRDLPFRQDSSFYYLSGCEIPDSSLVIAGTPADFKTTLFIPPLHPDEVMWMGLPPTPEQAQKMHDVHQVLTSDKLSHFIKDAVKSASPVLVLPGVKLDDVSTKDDVLWDAVEEARITKTDSEIELLRKANDISSNAHRELMRKIGACKTEYEAGAVFEYACKSAGARHQAYESIMASGSSSATLHYVDNRQPFPQSSAIMLVDAGAEYSNYCADITRSFPTRNSFSPEAKNIYQLVLDMQTVALSKIKAGASWEAIHLDMHMIVIKGLLKIGILRAGPSNATGEQLSQELYEKNLSTPFYPHGLGHNLGLDVHDCPGKASKPQGPSTDPKLRYLRLRRTLVENQVITVEPGCYFNAFLLEPVKDSPHVNHELVKEYLKIGGVRIEDNVIVTKEGCINLTTAPKELAEVERLVAEGSA